jgi:hypothetical protein
MKKENQARAESSAAAVKNPRQKSAEEAPGFPDDDKQLAEIIVRENYQSARKRTFADAACVMKSIQLCIRDNPMLREHSEALEKIWQGSLALDAMAHPDKKPGRALYACEAWLARYVEGFDDLPFAEVFVRFRGLDAILAHWPQGEPASSGLWDLIEGYDWLQAFMRKGAA